MSWYAVESVDTAATATRRFLFPFHPVVWLKLGLLVLLFGSIGGTNTTGVSSNVGSVGTNAPADGGDAPPAIDAALREISAAIPTDPTTIVLIGAAVLAVGLVWTIVSETARFVFYESIDRNDVTLLAPAKRRLGQAIRLVGFKLLVSGLFALPFVAVALAFYYNAIDPGSLGVLAPIGAIVLGLYGIVGGLIVVFVLRFTDEFVVPVMIRSNGGVLAGWRSIAPVLADEWKQFGVYIAVHFLLLLGIGLAQSIVLFVLFGIVAAIVGLLALVVVFGLAGGIDAAVASTVILAGLGTIGLLGVIVFVAIVVPIRLLVVTYVTTYELSVLRSLAPEYDLLSSIVERQ